MTEHKTSPLSITSPGIRSYSSSRGKPMKAVHGLMSLPTYLPSLSPFHSSSKSSSKSIKFYNRDEPYYEFTNFYRASVLIDCKKWPTTEHYFQAQKFIGTPYVEAIRCLPTAQEAFQLSRDPKVSRWRRSDWDTVKDDIMLKALRCKFAQHKSLHEKLWKTGDKELIEHTTNDSYWADGGGKGKGQNKLGRLLMKIRDEIVEVSGPYKPSSSKTSGLKRWSSSSDLSADHAPKKPNFASVDSTMSTSLKGTTLEITGSSSRLRRSSSMSRINLSQSGGTVESRLRSKSPEPASFSHNASSCQYLSRLQSPPHLLRTNVPTPPTSSNKRTTATLFYGKKYTGNARSFHRTSH